MKKIRIGHIGTLHDHSSGKMQCVLKFPDVFEVVGIVPEDDARWERIKRNPEYREIPRMTEEELIAAIPTLRERLGDRAILRALHFFAENRRVAIQKDALSRGDLGTFFENVIASGRSSFCYLQNVYTSKNLSEQGLSLADRILGGKPAAWRVHGGGFAGTIQAFVPSEDVETFRAAMDGAFGEGRCMVLRIRPVGAVKI